MRFGGHQTFSIREGWLYKGLRILEEEPEAFGTDGLQDYMGVGRNMAKSIQHWLVATSLAQPASKKGRKGELKLTRFGELVWRYDRYFLEPGTWWLIHTHLIHNRRNALSWNWFFNRFTGTRFERGVVVEGLRRYLQMEGGRMPSIRTLERDVACLLRSYAEVVPRERSDPENLLECPMIRLGLLTHSRHSGFYRINTGPKEIPFAVFGLVVTRAFSLFDESHTLDLSLTDLAQRWNGPGRIFALSAEALFEMLVQYQELGEERIEISSQAGERIVRINAQDSEAWMEEYLQTIEPEPVLTALP